MVDPSDKVEQIKEFVDAGEYFTINRARQYGKTTTLTALKERLKSEYIVISLDFQGISKSGFDSEQEFVQEFCRLLIKKKKSISYLPDEIENKLNEYVNQKKPRIKLSELFVTLTEWCEISPRGIILIIDEVDSATNNQVFLDFLAQLRDGYIARDTDDMPAFKSVILAGVTDVKHLKARIRDDEDAKENSPWNIAAEFTIDMSLSECGIKGMLDEYESDHHTGMDTEEMAKLIHDYTNGYPFLVSRICELIDISVTKILTLSEAWTKDGVDEAIKLILAENNTLFESLTKNLNNMPELKASIRSILMEGTRLTWNPDQKDIVLMQMYGLVRNDHNTVRIANRIFETRLYNLFLSDEELKNNVFSREGELIKNQFIEDGKLNMRRILEKFIETYNSVCGPLVDRFIEKDGRELFLLYLKPIINGTGNYYIEAQTRNQTRTDIIVDYLGRQYIIELKIWRGERYNAEGEKQISEYLDYFNLNTGYMLSFNFNKKKDQGVRMVQIGDKTLFEGTL
ncbi:AAA-like domain-containing protein [Butyrivibrio sp. WCE2006]|uniref:AAA-like domain-containing protein n=1 Tax=Butyrivibrio sp. WCE2006 TaxID=1410611 RepID=UPI00067852F7